MLGFDPELKHGGNLLEASQRYSIPVDNWIDLSTGINPQAYPVTSIPAEVLQHLPYPQPEFHRAIQSYYLHSQNKTTAYLALPGTQAAIKALPNILPELPVILPEQGYQEHALHWLNNDTPCHFYHSLDVGHAGNDISALIQQNPAQHLVVINPNNPTGILFSVEQLHHWAKQLQQGGQLIIDEAFIDISPEKSLLCQLLPDNVIVLRSFGKFFGLAGLRLGFLFLHQSQSEKFSALQDHWQINGPAQYIATQALQDKNWQQQTITAIQGNGQKTAEFWQPIIENISARPLLNSGLFCSFITTSKYAQKIQDYLGQQGILVRLISYDKQQTILRSGSLPEGSEQLKRLFKTRDTLLKSDILKVSTLAVTEEPSIQV